MCLARLYNTLRSDSAIILCRMNGNISLCHERSSMSIPGAANPLSVSREA